MTRIFITNHIGPQQAEKWTNILSADSGEKICWREGLLGIEVQSDGNPDIARRALVAFFANKDYPTLD